MSTQKYPMPMFRHIACCLLLPFAAVAQTVL
ncbi:MAG: hypothetical protein ACI8W8_003682, partial [Rhodothermales bacterium]